MVGNVFSPYYAAQRRRGPADPLTHCAINAALYGPSGKHWAMTERSARSLYRDSNHFSLGPSSLAWNEGVVEIALDERAVPLPRRIQGRVRIESAATLDREFALDAAGRHHWRPIAAQARIEVELEHPKLRWTGLAYVDSNRGDAPLEESFTGWHWSRAHTRAGTFVYYDPIGQGESLDPLALCISDSGAIERVAAPPLCDLPRTAWGLARAIRLAGERPSVSIRTLEDTPFYTRSLVSSSPGGQAQHAMHESLDLARFGTRWVQALLPFRMPRRA
jgi:carotenoid 1,2-hydratase